MISHLSTSLDDISVPQVDENVQTNAASWLPPPISFLNMSYVSGSTQSHFTGPTQSHFEGPTQSHFAGLSQWIYNNLSFAPSQSPPAVPPYTYQGPYQPYGQSFHGPGSSNFVNLFQPYYSNVQTVYKPTDKNQSAFTFKLITNRISKCQGCKGSLRMDDNSLPQPPNDLIICRMECRPFISPDGTVKVPSKPSASHYHFNSECLSVASSNFDPSAIVLPEVVKKNLKPEHYALLAKFGIEY